MLFDKMFRQPYLDGDDGANLGGGGTATEQVSTENQQSTTTTEQQTEQQRIKVRFNHQEMELPYEEAVTHIQKGMNYEKAVERARQEALDEYIASQGYEWNGKQIKTKAEYDQALKEKEIFERYQAQGLPEDVVNELVEMKRFREETLAEKQAREAQEAKQREEQDFNTRKTSMFDEFLTEFKEYADPEKLKEIPKEVWAESDKWLKTGGREGRRLSDAWARHNYTKMISQQQTSQANQVNAQASTGSVKGNGLPDSGFISKEVYDANKGNSQWMMKNYDNLTKSMKKWR